MISLLFAGILCLTFDDRHWENWKKALPVFERHGAKATFFPSGDLNAEALVCLKKLDEAGRLYVKRLPSCRRLKIPNVRVR